MQKIAQLTTYLLIGIATAIFLLVAIPKVLFPYEMHWMEGSMVEQVSRVVSGSPLYCQPTVRYVPWLYEPLYYYVSAIFALIGGLSFQIVRLPSVLATVGLLIMLFVVVRKETGKSFYAFSAIGLYLGAYGKVEYCYVMARIDPFFNFLLVAAFVAIYYSRTSKGILSGAVFLVLAYFTKQTALVFAPALILYLWRFNGWKPAALFTSSVVLLTLGGVMMLDGVYEGWFTYYTLLVPAAKGKTLRWEYAFNGLIFFVLLRCWLLTATVSLIPLRSYFHEKTQGLSQASVFFGTFFLISLGAGFLGILNFGGGHNVLLPAAAACAFFLPIVVHDIVENRGVYPLLLWSIPVQLALLLSNPWKDPRNIAMQIDRTRQEEFFKATSAIPGEVWIPYHGYMKNFIGKQPFADMAAITDVLLVNDSFSHVLRRELDSSFISLRWAAIFSDLRDTIPHYRLSGTMENLNKSHLNDDTLIYIYKPN